MSKTTKNRTTYTEAEKAAYKAQQADEIQAAWTKLLSQALAEPGILSAAYRAFHNYSISNQMLAAMQLAERGLPLSPIASFNAWKEKGRIVKKGQKAIKLFMPVTVKKEIENEDGEKEESTFSRFVFKPNWFSLDQTEGEDYQHEAKTPKWNAEKALEVLAIEEVHFSLPNGNVQGFATGRSIAINPVAALPHKTRFHELAHVVLGHTSEAGLADSEETPRNIREVEAEGVAYICCATLGLPGLSESRGYIQNWIDTQDITPRSVARIFGAADKILKAGAPA
ncbi:MAG: ArdC-like ssDNA-binding domain-containing protein [Halothiobacillaceae bacterium]|nr:ArdC-like ssDNA-binding domain-containing protein [Halothiobacillaceae bacterium]